MWGHFKDEVLKACDEVCGKKSGRSKGGTWWWKIEEKEAVSRKNEAHKAMCKNSTDENKRGYKSMKNKANKAASQAMREKAEEAPTELKIAQMGCLG